MLTFNEVVERFLDLNNLNNLPYIGGSGLDSFTITIFD